MHVHIHSLDGHEHSHDHAHEHHGFESTEQAVALMTYMLEHNRHHAEELHDLAHNLSHMGSENAAELLHKALVQYNAGNNALEAALDALKGE